MPAKTGGDGPAVRAVLALGSNLGDRRGTLQSAAQALADVRGIVVTAVSPLVETAPVGGPPQPDYLNAVLVVETSLPPRALFAACRRVERDHGRERVVRWGARTLDIDVVTYGAQVLVSDDLVVPHPRAASRAFVLAPWVAVEPDAVLPGSDGVSTAVRDLLARAEDVDGLSPSDEPPLEVPT